MKPPIPINELVSNHAEDFTGFELELSNSLKSYIHSHTKQNLNVSIMVDTNEPVASQVDRTLIVRYNGRFYSQDPSGLDEHVKKWAATFPVDLDIESDKSLYKFTLKYPSIILPEVEEKEAIEEEPTPGSEPTPEGEEGEPEEMSEEMEPEESEEPETEGEEPPSGEEVEKEIEEIEK